MRSILITGGTGQVGLELAKQEWPVGIHRLFPGRDGLDLTRAESVATFFKQHRPACVISCGAWTAVDAAEDHVADCFLANAQGPAWLAEAAHAAGAPMIHLSTDYVFDGTLNRAYRIDDAVRPINAYGASKLAGEYAVRMANPRSVVLRTAWVVSPHRSNFLKTMLRLGVERPALSVVTDQRGCPTSATDIAAALRIMAMRLMDDPAAPCGIHHFVNAGDASWFALAEAIFTTAARLGVRTPRLEGITSDAFPTRARRPANSRLDTSQLTADFAIAPRPWREAVTAIVETLVRDGFVSRRDEAMIFPEEEGER